MVQHNNFFFIWVFFHEHSRFTGQQVKGEGISLTPLYQFHPLHMQLDISWTIAAESSLLHIASIRSLSYLFVLFLKTLEKYVLHIETVSTSPSNPYKISKGCKKLGCKNIWLFFVTVGWMSFIKLVWDITEARYVFFCQLGPLVLVNLFFVFLVIAKRCAGGLRLFFGCFSRQIIFADQLTHSFLHRDPPPIL